MPRRHVEGRIVGPGAFGRDARAGNASLRRRRAPRWGSPRRCESRNRSSSAEPRRRTGCRDARPRSPSRTFRSYSRYRRCARCGRRRRSRGRRPDAHRDRGRARRRSDVCRRPQLAARPSLSARLARAGASRRRNTRGFFPARCAAMMTPSAVPPPPVASGPVLQWVKTFAPLGISSSAVFADRAIDRALLSRGSALASRQRIGRRRRRDRPPSARLTAVGRAARMRRGRGEARPLVGDGRARSATP